LAVSIATGLWQIEQFISGFWCCIIGVALSDTLSVVPQRRQAMWLQLAWWSPSDHAVVSVNVNLYGNLLHYRYWNLLEMCFRPLHYDCSLRWSKQ